MTLPDGLEVVSRHLLTGHNALTEKVRPGSDRVACGGTNRRVVDHKVRGVIGRSAVVGRDGTVRATVPDSEVDLVEPDSRVPTEDEVAGHVSFWILM